MDMKRIFRSLICVGISSFLLCSCGREAETQSLNNDIEEAAIKTEKIYNSTGCRVVNAQSIVFMNDVFIDSKGYRYLYGARSTKTGRMFWFSQYTPEGNLIWETNKVPDNEKYSRAILAKELNNGNIVVACVIDIDDSNMESKTMIPTILSTSDGIATFIKIKEQYFYSYVNVYEKSFICGIDGREISLNPKADGWFAQISNKGKIIQLIPHMAIPYGNTIWEDEINFISADRKVIKRGSTSDPSYKWEFYTNLPADGSYTLELSLNEDIVTAKYTFDTINKDVVLYRISYSTGKIIQQNEPEDNNPNESEFKYLDIGKEYLAPNNMTVIMNSINITDNNQGTIYYTINYTLKNKTKSDIIPEGSFDAYSSGLKKEGKQYGFFDNLYPGESKTREYTFRTLPENPFVFIQYNHQWSGNDMEILKNSLKWKV